ncbi:MAG: PEP-CTERM sorting domain-containing protein, partial [Candidatus Acidiferrales bacterium]
VFAIGHDDGASFYVDGTLIPGISPFGTSYALTDITYTGPTESAASLLMVYGECCGAPAVFATNLPTGGGSTLTPEPSAFLLLGTGLLGLMLVSRRLKLFVS